MSRYSLSREELGDILGGEPRYRVDQVWSGLYRRAADPLEMRDLPLALRHRLAGEPALAPALRPVTDQLADAGQTRKWLWALDDANQMETVLMHYPDRSTVCVSSQAGCAMGCGFCATGQAGFSRHLTSGEIVEQVARALRACLDRGRRLSNVVFMGMGEPLANYARVWPAVERIHADFELSARHLTISTVGMVPGIRRLAGEDLPVGLAVSLHAANDALRDRLVPVNRRWPLAELMAACHQYLSSTGRRLSLEWALIDGINDRQADASELAGLALELGAHVNLIPLNPTPGWPAPGSPLPQVTAFAWRLRCLGVNVTVRQTRGAAIAAACGQLAAGAGRGSPPPSPLGPVPLGPRPRPGALNGSRLAE